MIKQRGRPKTLGKFKIEPKEPKQEVEKIEPDVVVEDEELVDDTVEEETVEVDTKSGLTAEQVEKLEVKEIRFKFKNYPELTSTENLVNLILYTCLRLHDIKKLNFNDDELSKLKMKIASVEKARTILKVLLDKCNSSTEFEYKFKTWEQINSTDGIIFFMYHIVAKLHLNKYVNLTPQDRQKMRSFEQNSRELQKLIYQAIIYYSNLDNDFTMISEDYWRSMPDEFKKLLVINTNQYFL